MVFGSTTSSPRANLSLQQLLEVANTYLDDARNTKDSTVALVFCHDTEVSLAQLKKVAKRTDDKSARKSISSIYLGLGQVLDTQGHREEAQAFYKKSERWGVHQGRPFHHSRTTSIVHSIKSALSTSNIVTEPSPAPIHESPHMTSAIATLQKGIFPTNVRPPILDFDPPDPDARLNSTMQLACCLGVLRSGYELDDIVVPSARQWLQTTQGEPDEQERLKTLATDVIRAFKRDEFKDAKAVTEVVFLAPVLDKDDFRYLVKEFYSGIDQSGLLDVHQLEGLSRVIQGAGPGYFDADDLVQVLDLLSKRLQGTHQQSPQHLYQLTLAVSNVLDAMADAEVKGLDRENLHEPLMTYLDGLKESSDPYLVYQAAYAYQALLCVPDNESLWKATLRRTKKIVKGVSGLVSAVKGLDLSEFIEGLENIQRGLSGAPEMVQLVKDAYKGATSLAEGGKMFLDCMREGLSFSHKAAWYSALRGIDTMIQEGQLADFRKLVCEAPCRRDLAFQWGVCQRLGDIAANSTWDLETRREAIAFLGEIYKDDSQWGQHTSVKQWILNILMQLSAGSDMNAQVTKELLRHLQSIGDESKQALYRLCCENGPGIRPLKVELPTIGIPSLIDRVQERPDVEGQLRQLRRHRLKERGVSVYIPPLAKTNLQDRDEACFPLMKNVDQFLSGDQMVFLLLGESGAGKSTFNRELEHQLWQRYKKETGVIPLYINLPAIDKPEHEMIAKQLRKVEFTEPQIRELKQHRTFILICDGYDESQQTHNLYTSNRLNQPGEWNVKMVISCRSEYIGVDYRDRFQPGDRNQRSDPTLLREAVITPFSLGQVQDYIDQYVSLHRPLWEATEYKKALDHITSLKELVKNPFLMSLSLEVLPRMVDPGQDLSSTHVTRVSLYDQFMEQWMERGKKRVGEKNLSPLARSAYESLTDEGFTRNGIAFLKNLSAAIYKEQGGQPIVSYSRYKDEGSWKSEFFGRDDEKQLLREACPFIRNGHQYRFMHRSLLEYSVALAVFDPHDWKEKVAPEQFLARRGSTSSVLSLDGQETTVPLAIEAHSELDLDSPIAWRNFVNEPSVLQFLEERVQQEPQFKKYLLDYIEQSKVDKEWRTAAANAITILVRAGVQFNHADLRGIRIPKADVSHGVFDSVQLQGADLRQVDFRGVWLRGADLRNARMTGAQFGELPYLEQSTRAMICTCSSDGKTLSVGLYDGIITVYSTSRWEKLWTLEGHDDGPSEMVYSPKNNQLASGSYDKTIRLWDIERGRCERVLCGHSDSVRSVVYSAGGKQLASVGDDSTLRLWDVDSGECCHILIGHTDWVYRTVYSPNGNQIASSGKDAMIRLWNINPWEGSCILRGHTSSIEIIVYSTRGDQIATASTDATVRLWDLKTGDCRHILHSQNSNNPFVMFSPKGNRVVTKGPGYNIQLWDVATGVLYQTLHGHTNPINSIVYSHKGDLVASGSDDLTVRLWDSETGACSQVLTGHSYCVNSVVFSPNDDQVISASSDDTVRLWNVGSRASRHVSSAHDACVNMVKFSPNGAQIATCSDDKTVRLWDVATGKCRHILRGHTSHVMCVGYSVHGDQVVTGSSDTTVLTWNTMTGSCIHSMAGHSNWVRSVAFSPHGDYIISSSDDQTIKFWDTSSGTCRHTLTGHTGNVYGAIFSPDGRQIASKSQDSTVRLWNIETKECSHVLQGHLDNVFAIAYSPQGNMIASGGCKDCTVRLWDTATGECKQIIIAQTSRVMSIAYSPKGDQIVLGSRDGFIRQWDIEAGTCLRVLSGHDSEITNTVYSTSGDLLLSGSDDATLRLWDSASGQCWAVKPVFNGIVTSISWIEVSGNQYVAAASADGSFGIWRVERNDNQWQLGTLWRTTKGELTVKNVNVQDVKGLNPLDTRLLKQRGCIGEPMSRLREAGKKLTDMASVISNLKTSVGTAVDSDTLDPGATDGRLSQWVEQTNDLMVQSILANFAQDIKRYK